MKLSDIEPDISSKIGDERWGLLVNSAYRIGIASNDEFDPSRLPELRQSVEFVGSQCTRRRVSTYSPFRSPAGDQWRTCVIYPARVRQSLLARIDRIEVSA